MLEEGISRARMLHLVDQCEIQVCEMRLDGSVLVMALETLLIILQMRR